MENKPETTPKKKIRYPKYKRTIEMSVGYDQLATDIAYALSEGNVKHTDVIRFIKTIGLSSLYASGWEMKVTGLWRVREVARASKEFFTKLLDTIEKTYNIDKAVDKNGKVIPL